jgi:hypothetical protein
VISALCGVGRALVVVGGQIVIRGWNLPNATREYERTAATFEADAWIIGRISMGPYAGKARVPRRTARERIAREDFVAPHETRSYAVAIDPSGKLRWSRRDKGGEHVITILTESVSDDYLGFLQSKGVSYLFGGKSRIDFPRVLAKLLSVAKRPGGIVWLRYKVAATARAASSGSARKAP